MTRESKLLNRNLLEYLPEPVSLTTHTIFYGKDITYLWIFNPVEQTVDGVDSAKSFGINAILEIVSSLIWVKVIGQILYFFLRNNNLRSSDWFETFYQLKQTDIGSSNNNRSKRYQQH